MTQEEFIELHGSQAWELLLETVKPPNIIAAKFLPKDMPDRGHRAIMRILERLGLVEANGLIAAEQEMCRKDKKISDLQRRIGKLQKQ